MREQTTVLRHDCVARGHCRTGKGLDRAFSPFTAAVVCLSILFLSGSVYTQEEVVVNIDSILGPATQRGSGILGGFRDNDPPDSVFFPLKFKFLRGDKNEIIAGYSRCVKLGASVEISTANYGGGWSGGQPNSGNYAAWEKYHKDLVMDVQARKWERVSYSFWNDCDWPGRWDGFFQAWKRAYFAVKSVDSNAVTVGPNNSFGPVNNCWWWNKGWTGDDLTKFVRDFIDSCIANNCLPEILAYHDWSVTGANVIPILQSLDNHLIKRGKKPIPFEEDDMGPPSGGGNGFGCRNPALQVSFLANVERTNIIRSARCWWANDDWQLDGYITGSKKPRSLWWAQKAYADITGSIVEVVPSTSIDGVAGIDSGTTVRAVFGRYKKASGTVTISITNLNRHRNSKVVALRINNTEDNELVRPTKTLDTTVAITDGKIAIALKDFNGGDAYQLTATLLNPISGVRPSSLKSNPAAVIKPMLSFKDGTVLVSAAGPWELALCDLSGSRITERRGVGASAVRFAGVAAAGYLVVLKLQGKEEIRKFVPGR